MKRVLAPSLFITYPPSPFYFKGLFLYFLPFLTLDKIKVGGDSCLPQHCCIYKNKSQFTVLQNWRLCWGRIKRGVTLELSSYLYLLVCFVCFTFKGYCLGICLCDRS